MKGMTAELPNLDHISLADESRVYVPSDDTFLLCDALLKEKDFLLEDLKPKILVEMGCGSGCVITYLNQLLLQNNYSSFQSFGLDINIHALELTRKTYERNINGLKTIELIRTNLFQCMEDIPDCNIFLHGIDILIFNPPYVPSDSTELGKTL